LFYTSDKYYIQCVDSQVHNYTFYSCNAFYFKKDDQASDAIALLLEHSSWLALQKLKHLKLKLFLLLSSSNINHVFLLTSSFQWKAPQSLVHFCIFQFKRTWSTHIYMNATVHPLTFVNVCFGMMHLFYLNKKIMLRFNVMIMLRFNVMIAVALWICPINGRYNRIRIIVQLTLSQLGTYTTNISWDNNSKHKQL